MRKHLVITDVTRMQEGRVCVVGYDQNGNCIRPVLPPPGIQEDTLYSQGRPIVFPFAVVEYDLLRPLSDPPHTEDCRYDPASVRFIKRLDGKHRREILTPTLSQSVAAVFQVPIFSDVGHYVMKGQGSRSLGTVQPQRIIKAIYEQSPEGKWKYRLGFDDGGGTTYWLTITDLTWRYYNDYRRRERLNTPEEIASNLTSVLRSSEVYLRVGLTRGWKKYPDRCFIQITGVYTFPDYLEGRTFADFAPTFKRPAKTTEQGVRVDAARAMEIIVSLAEGLNPYTGEAFDPESPYQHPDTVRALYKAKEALERMARYERKKRLPENAGKSWTEEEEAELVASFEASATIKDLATSHRRTRGAIESRLVKLGKIQI